MEENKNNKKKILILGILLVIVTIGVLGITYAAYNFQREGDSNELVTGDIYMHYKGKNAGISIEDAVPSKTYDPKEYFEFTIEGKNTYTENDIWYEIDLVDGDQPDGRTTRIDDKYLRFTLTEQIGSGQEKIVVNSVGYDDITNKKIWVNKIDRTTNNEITITYKLYMWISDEVHIGYDDTEEISSDYTVDEWNSDIYASVKVNVKGDFIEKEIDETQYSGLPRFNMIDTIKEKAYTDEKEIIMLDVTDKSNITKCASTEACAEKEEVEYRYSGPEVNNYITLTDNAGVEETWRIIGIFNDEEVGEYIKIVRDEVLPESYLPTTFKASDGNAYTIKSSSNLAFWNKLKGNSSDKNNWPTSGLKYYLNAEQETGGSTNGYLYYLSSDVKDQLVEVKQYLGTMTYDQDNPKTSYQRERDVESCLGGKGPSKNTSKATIQASTGCQVWADNDATWTGEVSLMYPSDYGLSAVDTNWDKKYYDGLSGSFFQAEINATTWMYQTMSDAKSKSSWMLSPPSSSANYAAVWDTSGYVNNYGVYNSASGVRPVLSLSSLTSIVGDGDGTKNNPYKIVE